MPAKAAANIQQTFAVKVRKETAKCRPFACALQAAQGTRHRTVLGEEIRIVILVLLHKVTFDQSRTLASLLGAPYSRDHVVELRQPLR